MMEGVKSMIMKEEKLTEGSMVYEAWLRSSNATYLKFSLFNITNPKEFACGAKLVVKEIGPFVYREVDMKLNISWNHDQTLMTYYDNTTYVFEPAMSYGDDESTNITTINLVMVGIEIMLNRIKAKWAETILGYLVSLIGREEIIMTRSVREILWGYHDPLLCKIKNNFINTFVDIPTDFIQLQANGTDQLLPTIVATGVGDLRSLNQYKMWENLTSLSKWGTPKARKLYGTDGHLFHPNISRGENLTAFIDQIYRSGYFSYVRDVEVYGVSCYQYGIPYEEMANATMNPQNAGFYSFGPSGLLNFSIYAPFNLPIFVSKPHFLDTDPIVSRNISGLMPNRSKHDSYVNVEPLTGFVLGAAKKLQFNVQLNRSDTQRGMKNLPNVLFPIFWASETGDASSSDVAELKNTVFYALRIANILIYTSMGVLGLVALLIMLCTFPLLFFVWRENRKSDYIPVRNDFQEDWIYPPLLNSSKYSTRK